MKTTVRKMVWLVLWGSTMIPVAAQSRGSSYYHSGNFLDGLVGLIAVAASGVWLHSSWKHWVVRKKTGAPAPRFQDSSDMALCLLGWAFMACLISVGPLFLARAVAGRDAVLVIWPYTVAALFALILWFKRT